MTTIDSNTPGSWWNMTNPKNAQLMPEGHECLMGVLNQLDHLKEQASLHGWDEPNASQIWGPKNGHIRSVDFLHWHRAKLCAFDALILCLNHGQEQEAISLLPWINLKKEAGNVLLVATYHKRAQFLKSVLPLAAVYDIESVFTTAVVFNDPIVIKLFLDHVKKVEARELYLMTDHESLVAQALPLLSSRDEFYLAFDKMLNDVAPSIVLFLPYLDEKDPTDLSLWKQVLVKTKQTDPHVYEQAYHQLKVRQEKEVLTHILEHPKCSIESPNKPRL